MVSHDDLVISAALAALLDRQPLSLVFPTAIIHAPDPLDELDVGW